MTATLGNEVFQQLCRRSVSLLVIAESMDYPPPKKKKESKTHTHTHTDKPPVCVCGLLASSVLVFMFLVPAKLYGFYGELKRIYALPHPHLFAKSLTWNTLFFSQNTGK